MRTANYVAVAVLVLLLGGLGCGRQNSNDNTAMSSSNADTTRNANVNDAVGKALEQADLKDIHVNDDTDKNVTTLTGVVHSPDAKERAAEVAKSAAPGRIIANELSVQPVGAESQAKSISSNVDDGIEKNFKAAIIANGLDKAHIRANAKNGVLTLKGTVDTEAQREEAQKVASSVPNVTQVVNELQVKGQPGQ